MRFKERELEKYMGRCVYLAKQAPSGIAKPYVGALVISESGDVVGEGYKSFIGGSSLLMHAERMALDEAGELARNGVLITTLEPCVRAKKNQLLKSCSELIVERSVSEVVVGAIDFVYSGEGVNYLRNQGVKVRIYEGLTSLIERELKIKKR